MFRLLCRVASPMALHVCNLPLILLVVPIFASKITGTHNSVSHDLAKLDIETKGSMEFMNAWAPTLTALRMLQPGRPLGI